MQLATTLELTPDTVHRLDVTASSMNITRDILIQESVLHFLEYDTWFRAEVQKGLDAIQSGHVVDTHTVKERLRSRGYSIV